jgi:hypothetical protein
MLMKTAESTKMENSNLEMPPFRPLKVYAFDPTRGRTLGNYMTINNQFETLNSGPVGKYLEVIDYDASNKCYYQAVDLDDPRVLLTNGLDPSESDPQFHQQMVYAVASETIRRFEYALGRSIKWDFAKHGGGRRPKMKKPDYRQRLRIFPHAMQEANAFYSRELRALLFGYFASDPDSAWNIPGQTVFTCLSHDIIAHETTHALVDSQRRYFTEPTSPDSLAFHEAFADIVALFQHFTFKEPLLEMIRRTGGKIFRTTVGPESEPDENGPTFHAQLASDNPLVGLALQFGEALGMRKALRSAIGSPPNSRALEELYEPHSRGSILVAAVFDAFFSVYVRRTRDLIRIARAGGVQISPDDMHPDLVNRLAETATKTADNFLNICIRALDYCPPVHILFGDFLRAMITADHNLVPNDKYGYRAALIDAFRSRGIFPESVTSFSEESLLWDHPQDTDDDSIPRCMGLEFHILYAENEEKIKKQQKNNAHVLHEFAVKNAEKLHLSSDPELNTWVSSFQEMHHVSDTGRLVVDFVVQIIQSRDVPIDKDDPNSPSFKFRGGITLILGQDGQVRYIIYKSIDKKKNDVENKRLTRQRDYLLMRQSDLAMASYVDMKEVHERAFRADFSMIHRGY